ncbi:MAG: thioredoxin domain-containing protein [Candidatus Promineifilaceae bacterium]|nr:thioredoxin domain-containing protein [Candidatus Promineifilaceae bacterium]
MTTSPTSRPHIRLLPVLVALLLLALAACGPSGRVNDPAPAEGTDSATQPATTSESESDALDTTETTEETTAGETGVDAQNSIDVDSESIEEDANGVTVGFTEEGYAFRGDPAAPVVMEEFSDFQCPYCSRFFEQTLPSIEENQIANGEVVLVFYDFPLTRIHPQAPLAAEAAHCAGEAGAATYWQMHDTLFENIGEWSGKGNADAIFVGYAEALDLDANAFADCLEEDRYVARVQTGLEKGGARGVNSTPSFFINDQPLIGARPLADFNEAIATVKEGGELAAEEPASAPQGQPSAAPTPASFSENIAGARGNADAPVTIVEFTDYQCPYCSSHAEQVLPQIVEQLIETGDVYYILKDLPLDNIHPRARAAATAARCAGEQDAYWSMHDALFENQARWSQPENAPAEIFNELADELELDGEAFSACLDSGRYDEEIEANFNEARTLGIGGTPYFFVDGYPIPGTQPFELFEYAVSLAQEGRLAEAYAPQPTPEPAPSEPVDVPVGDAPSIGEPDAPVTIVEYTDYQCPYCSRHFQQTYPQIVENYVETGVVRYVFKDFPLTSIHPQAVEAAEAARCARDQGAFIEMHDMLFERQEAWAGNGNATEIFTGFAEELGLDGDAFTRCLESGEYEEAVMADLEEGTGLGVRGTPTFFINGRYMDGARPFSSFEEMINDLTSE